MIARVALREERVGTFLSPDFSNDWEGGGCGEAVVEAWAVRCG